MRTPDDYAYLYITLTLNTYLGEDITEEWDQIAWQQGGFFECFIFSKPKTHLTLQDQDLLKVYGHVPDNWNFPAVYAGYLHAYPGHQGPVTPSANNPKLSHYEQIQRLMNRAEYKKIKGS